MPRRVLIALLAALASCGPLPNTEIDGGENAAADAAAGTGADTFSGTDAATEADGGTDAAADADTDAGASTDAGADAVADADTDAGTDTDAGPDATADADTDTDAGPDATADADTDAGTDPDAGPDAAADADTDAGTDPDAGTDGGSDAGVDAGVDSGGGDPCPLGSRCNPIRIDTTPLVDARDTRVAPESAVSSYACAPSTRESGGEFWYEVDVLERSKLSVALDDVPGDGVDVDVQLLQSMDPVTCMRRNNVAFAQQLEPGTYYVVADTWANASDTAFPGPYTLTANLEPLPAAPCVMTPLDLEMYWTSCAPGIDCVVDGGKRWLRTPAVGPVALEAHLVTVDEPFAGGWPTSFTDQIDRHYAISQAATGYAMARNQPWAPAGEGGSHYGQAAYTLPLPVLEEGWYVNMYWRHRPAPGTKLIVMNPATGAAVVAAGGYETGPGSNTAIGGASEEIHHHLGTSHRGTLVFGFAANPEGLAYGPIDCE